MNKIIKNVYLTLFLITLYLVIYTPINTYKPKIWFYKSILIYLACIFMIYNVYFYNNTWINKNILAILLFLNIFILIPILLLNKFTYLTPIVLIGLIYLIITFNKNYFIFKNGKLIKLDKKWIYYHIIILILFYISLDKSYLTKFTKLILIILILYPLLFPLKEYFIHRVFTLSLVVALCWYNYKYRYIIFRQS